MLSREQALHLREQLSPAFAGYVLDGDISDRDILATLLDLVVKGSIHLDAVQGKPWTIRAIHLVKQDRTVKKFEQEFIKTLFKEKETLTLRQVQHAIASKELHRVIAEEGKAFQHFQGKAEVVMHDGAGRRIEFYNGKRKATTPQDIKEMYRGLPIVFIFFTLPGLFLFYLAGRQIADGELQGVFMLFLFGMVFVGVSLFTIISLIFARKRLRVNFNNDPVVVEKYQELFKYIKKHPLQVQRLHNEFMPFAVAFGIETAWHKSFGVKPEEVWDPAPPETAEEKQKRVNEERIQEEAKKRFYALIDALKK